MSLVAILGPTASGKSAVALALAEQLGAEIISVDSMQVYRGMDIGTAKPSPEERARVAHHLVDVVEPEDPFTVADTQRLGREIIAAAERPLFISGGTGLAFRAIVDPLEFPPADPVRRRELEEADRVDLRAELLALDPGAGRHLDLDNPRRVIRALEVHASTGLTPSARAATPAAGAVRRYQALHPFRAVGLDPGPGLEARIVRRFDAMLDRGLLAEVERLAPRLGRTAAQAVGYKELLPVLAGEITPEEGRERAIGATLKVARNQRTFFRRDPRIVWIEWDDDPGRRGDRVSEELAAWIS